MQASRLLQPLLWLAYPLVIFFGLQVLEPRYVAALLALMLILRRRHDAARLLSGLKRADFVILAGLLLLSLAIALTNSERLLRLYPVAVSLGMLALFGLSLRSEQSMIERFARLREPDLPAAGVAYTRRVTQIWCGFFVLNGSIAFYVALFSTRDIWALYNGLIAYVMMGALLLGEMVFRKLVLKAKL